MKDHSIANANQTDVVGKLAEEFLERYRNGERPPLSEYVDRHPECADDIRELFPALILMEDVGPSHDTTSDDNRDIEPGPQQLGDFRIIREVGRGGMGLVYEAEQVSLGRRVALKVLPKQTLLDSKHQKRFLREAKAAARLHHTNIVPVFGVGHQDGLHYYVMQFIHGLGLDEVLVELQRLRDESQASGGRKPTGSAPVPARAAAVAQSLISGHFDRTLLVDSDSEASDQLPETGTDPDKSLNSQPSPLPSPSTAVGRLSDTFTLPGQSEHTSKASSRTVYFQSVARIGSQAAQALQYAHDQGIVHRDVKPGNLLLDARGSVWVTDFGLAKAADQQDLTHTGDVLGTLRYMAPEQFDGNADARSDVFSLGLTLYELLALKPAFDETERHRLVKQVTTGTPVRLRTIDPHVPRDLETIVHKAIDREPSHRYQTAEELAADLQRYLGSEPISARWISPVTRFARWCRRNPLVAGLTTTIAVLLVSAAVVSSLAADHNSELNEKLSTSLDNAQRNLELATAEQKRAEVNLDLALEALDGVYLDAIAFNRFLGEPVLQIGAGDSDFSLSVRPPLTDLEKELLRRGLSFYEQFALQNPNTPSAAVKAGRSHYRVALLQAALGDKEAAADAYRATIEQFNTLVTDDPDNHDYFCQLGMAYTGLSRVVTSQMDAKEAATDAEAAFSLAIVLQPDDDSLYQARGAFYLMTGQFECAMSDLNCVRNSLLNRSWLDGKRPMFERSESAQARDQWEYLRRLRAVLDSLDKFTNPVGLAPGIWLYRLDRVPQLLVFAADAEDYEQILAHSRGNRGARSQFIGEGANNLIDSKLTKDESERIPPPPSVHQARDQP